MKSDREIRNAKRLAGVLDRQTDDYVLKVMARIYDYNIDQLREDIRDLANYVLIEDDEEEQPKRPRRRGTAK